jgi:hypothetical protein
MTVLLSRERSELLTPEGRSALRQAEDIGNRPSVTAYHGDFEGDRMQASSAVEVFFARPPGSETNAWGARQGKPRELASLFNPYWQVRLVDPTSSNPSSGAKP